VHWPWAEVWPLLPTTQGAYDGMKLRKAVKPVREGYAETLTYMAFPRKHWRSLRTNNPLERIMKEIHRRTRVVGGFPDGKLALMLVAARLRHMVGARWGEKKYMNMDHIREQYASEDLMPAIAG